MSRRTALYSPPCHPCGPDPQPDPVALIQLDGAAKRSFERRHARLPEKGLAFALAFLFDGLRHFAVSLLPSDRARQAETNAFTNSTFATTAFASAGAER